MNYFELFEIPVQLKVNKTALPARYIELSKKYHPDYFVKENEDVQLESLERSAMLNKAYKTFQDPDETIKYVLQLKGLLEEEEKYELPAEFLMEVLDLNESLESGVGSTELTKKIEDLHKEIYEPVKEIVEHYQEGISTEKELLQVKEYYYKKKYLKRIRSSNNHPS
jgi:molecular chaperone HscB